MGRLIGGSGGSGRGRVPLDDLPVTWQPTGNTCVPACLDMLLEHHAPGRLATHIENCRLRAGGMTIADAVGFIDDNLAAIGLRTVRGDLDQAIRSGRPFIAFIAEVARGHAVLVQEMRASSEGRALVVRDPAGGAYLEGIADFGARVVQDESAVAYPAIWGE